MEGMFSEGAEGTGSCGCRIRKGTEEKLEREERREKLGDRSKSTEDRGRGAYISDSCQSSGGQESLVTYVPSEWGRDFVREGWIKLPQKNLSKT